MQRVDFFRLERPIQERFVASAQGTSAPVPFAVLRQGVSRAVIAWVLVSVISLLCLVLLARAGYGSLSSSFALQPITLLAPYALIGVLAGASVFAALRKQRARLMLPFAPGIYLFPSGVIDARTGQFEVRKVNELADASVQDRGVRLRFEDGAEFRFPADSAERGAEMVKTLSEVKQHFGQDLGSNSRELAVFDPLCDNGFRNPFSPRESILPKKASLALGGWLLSALLGAALGAGLWTIRNTLGEAALYRTARAVGTREGYRAYLARGGKHPDVSGILLPRAELAEVIQRHSLPELERFAKEHPDSQIQPEVQAALHQELVVALADAKREGTLQALKKFRARFEGYPRIIAEVDQAISARMTTALRDFERRARPKPEVLELFRRLLNYSALHEGRVEVRFRRRMPESVEKAEALLQKSNYFGGKASLPAQYFDQKHAALREKPSGQEIVNVLSQGFPEDLLKFELGPPLEDSPEDDPKVKVPSIVITHRTEMSGAYLMKRPRAALTGVGVLFRVVFAIPNDPAVHAFKYSAWNPPDLKSMMDGRSFEEIYNEMGDKAFSKLAKKYLLDLVPGLAQAKPAAAP
ncbi:MAG TPA: hypothetical protein VG937_08895 [Polyangiaceae bacterium]|nr:hypothetical protein [Polyangiaceae bacterium]